MMPNAATRARDTCKMGAVESGKEELGRSSWSKLLNRGIPQLDWVLMTGRTTRSLETFLPVGSVDYEL